MPRHDSRDDSELMRAVQGGDRAAFDALVERHSRYVLNILYKYLHNRDEAEDLAQEVFLRVYTKRDSYEPLARFTTWLYTIAANLCLNHIRDRRRAGEVSLQGIGSDSSQWEPADTTSIIPSHTIDGREMRDVVWKALDELPDQQRMAIILYRFEEMSYQEVADTLGVSISALKSLIFRARGTLAEKLEEYIRKQ